MQWNSPKVRLYLSKSHVLITVDSLSFGLYMRLNLWSVSRQLSKCSLHDLVVRRRRLSLTVVEVKFLSFFSGFFLSLFFKDISPLNLN